MEKKKFGMEEILYMQQEIVKWNKVFDNDVNDKSLIETYFNLTDEELNGKGEYLDSLRKGDKVGTLDGLIDVCFTGIFWACLAGIPFEEWDEMYFFLWRGDLDWNNCDGFTVEDHWAFTTELGNALREHSEEFDILGAFERVLKSNYSKAMYNVTPEDAEEEVKKIEAKGRYADVYYETKDDYTIFKAKRDLQEGKTYPKGKIVKPSSFKDPEDLGGLQEFIYV